MSINLREGQSLVHLKPGQYFVSDRSVVIQTLLGSCVSACLYDPVARIAGMNHFLLSNRRYAKDMPTCITEAGRYGINAMEIVINEMLKKGAKKDNLLAKAFGGASVMSSPGDDNFFCVGDVNSRFIVEFLQNEGISLVRSDLGGEQSRIIYFDSEDYSVYVRKVRRTLNPKLALREKGLWNRSMEKQEKEISEPELWI